MPYPASTVPIACSLLSLLSIGLLVYASLHDIAVRSIPNLLCGVLAMTGVLLRLADRSLVAGLAAACVVFVATAMCCWRGWIGGGDVKLLSATTLIIPPLLVGSYIFCVGLAGGLLAIAYMLLRHLVPEPGPRPRRWIARVWRTELFRIRRGGPLPYGVGIAAGAIGVLLIQNS